MAMRLCYMCRCRVKVALCHTCIVLCMCTVVQHLHDIGVIHIRQNSVHGHPNLVKWLGLSVTVRVRVRARDGILQS